MLALPLLLAVVAGMLLTAPGPAEGAGVGGARTAGRTTLPSDTELLPLQARLGFNFTNPWVLREALAHPSFGGFNNLRCGAARRRAVRSAPPSPPPPCRAAHCGTPPRRRLTWVGDAVLGLLASARLFMRLPHAAPSALHARRLGEVTREACAGAARTLGIDELLVVGPGYAGAQPTDNMLAGERGSGGRYGRVQRIAPGMHARFAPHTATLRGVRGPVGGHLR